MRPVLLDLDGFGSFRERTTVDFADAEFFALVGPTGAGKSTVVDAIVFALYGSVPRWDNRRAVEWALAPTAGRGVVRLVFDLGPTRYTVTRELRRSAQGKVTVKNARLERGTEVLAADSEVSPAVEALLGLSYDHFVRCVILPQGDFARFLHSTAKERQDTLVDLLGIRVYREVAERSRAEAAAQKQRADFATQRLAAYGDATALAEQAATARADALRKLAAEVGAAVPRLLVAGRALAEAAAEADRVAAERATLTALRVPADLDELAARGRAAAAALAVADDALASAEKADTAAREARDAAGDRAALDRARDAWTELSDVTAQLPAALTARSRAEAALRAVETDGAAARGAVTAARAARDDALHADLAAALRPHLVPGEPCPVCAQTVPGEPDGAIPGLALSPVPEAGTSPVLAAADRRVAEAEAAVVALQRDWQAANRAAQVAGGRAEALAARAGALRDQLADRPAPAEVDAGLAVVAAAEDELRAADRALRDARRARDSAAQADRDVRARLAAARSAFDTARDPLVRLGAPAPERADLAADWLALADWALAAAEERSGVLARAQESAAAARVALAGEEDDLRARLERHQVAVDRRRPLADAAEPAVAAAESQARATAARIAERRAEAAGLADTVREAEEAAGVARLLGQLLRADGFERWLLTSALDVLVADAGATLLELSGGQFELTHDGKDFAVVDHADADSVRPVRTLSGGETFQASLALALALSAQLAGLAAGGGAGGRARLDAIVLDEGFGTLDEATLDVVATTLESLAAGGERMVGVVTHVGALAERVPVRFSVRRTLAGSTVERQS